MGASILRAVGIQETVVCADHDLCLEHIMLVVFLKMGVMWSCNCDCFLSGNQCMHGNVDFNKGEILYSG